MSRIEPPCRPEILKRPENIIMLGEFKERRKQYSRCIIDSTREAFEGCGGNKICYVKYLLPNLLNTLDDVMIDYAFSVKRFDFEFPKVKIMMNHTDKPLNTLGDVGMTFDFFNYRFIFNSDDGIGFDCSKIN